ncbi:PREDICTED: uncharacterized protein LOC101240405 [Paramuricea clavata]|uniref:PREDICTED: uncharacterized protein LOC101240405 n=1 Tax=Paramuricea clavata TaxID=317549 RepID=A0A7D9HTB4_PARCT|nr:PREDICTED: uncharacterized protein LOC101240405 [Paramuricea clavata]
MVGLDFVAGFLKRHSKLSLRRPKSVSVNRVFGLNKTSVNLYFDNLKILLNKHNFKPHEIFNCDESGLACVHKPVKVIAPKEKRRVSGAYKIPQTIFDLPEDEGIDIPEDLKYFPYRATSDFECYFKHESHHPRNTEKLTWEAEHIPLCLLQHPWLR